jgi:hypothetical protein
LYWVSSPDATHSRNIATRPDAGIAIFDSAAPIGTGQGVYLRARAAVVSADELDQCIEVFSRRSQAHGGAAWVPADVQARPGWACTGRWSTSTGSWPRTAAPITGYRSGSPDAGGAGSVCPSEAELTMLSLELFFVDAVFQR